MEYSALREETQSGKYEATERANAVANASTKISFPAKKLIFSKRKKLLRRVETLRNGEI